MDLENIEQLLKYNYFTPNNSELKQIILDLTTEIIELKKDIVRLQSQVAEIRTRPHNMFIGPIK